MQTTGPIEMYCPDLQPGMIFVKSHRSGIETPCTTWEEYWKAVNSHTYWMCPFSVRYEAIKKENN